MLEYSSKTFKMTDSFVKKYRKMQLQMEILENDLEIVRRDANKREEFAKILKKLRSVENRKSELIHEEITKIQIQRIYDWDLYNRGRTLVIKYFAPEAESELESWQS